MITLAKRSNSITVSVQFFFVFAFGYEEACFQLLLLRVVYATCFDTRPLEISLVRTDTGRSSIG
jgi:hypothetical protein